MKTVHGNFAYYHPDHQDFSSGNVPIGEANKKTRIPLTPDQAAELATIDGLHTLTLGEIFVKGAIALKDEASRRAKRG